MGRSAKFFRLGQTKSERDRIRISKNTKVEKIQNVPERVKKVSNGARAGLEAVMADAPNTHDAVMTLVSSARSQKPRPAAHAAPNSSKKPTLDNEVCQQRARF
ncbi:hypothetical protein BASA61_000412 [Batrachochytrium salamandrivorans]|nr:hypothetical protein BASA61_000412 [Batrachochytrium salamandrivorans]